MPQLDDLDRAILAALEENGFVVTPGRARQIYQAYQQAGEAGWPLFVTADALLHTHHVLYDYALRLADGAGSPRILLCHGHQGSPDSDHLTWLAA